MSGSPELPLRVLIVAEHASARFGGEAFLPLHYFRLLRARGVEAWLVCHERVKDELIELLPEERERMDFVEDTPLQVGLWRVGARLPGRLNVLTTGALLHLDTQLRQRALVRRIVRERGINIVHEPIPVSPLQPSALFGVDAPVVIGPMNGGMTFPSAFRSLERSSERLAHQVVRSSANLANVLIPGKRAADLLLVANPRTRAALPSVLRGVRVLELVENGVDFDCFQPRPAARSEGTLRVAFVGRLLPLKAVDVLLDALSIARRSASVELEVFGDGPVRGELESQAGRLGLEKVVTFHGFVPQREIAVRLRQIDVLAMPSVRECGGAVVLEAMAMGLPVVAANWGGPADYLNEECGFLVDPISREHLARAFADALVKLHDDPELWARMGAAARERAREYDWNRKIDKMLGLYREIIARRSQGRVKT